ncbi:MAG: FAD-dependent 5-carboxymethylaminomethyl-2-thiouridine(34) oxidoreductase MnmC, partial [Oleibacter sp.]|nr:FAD-dependent 5-carboxymethylaminomethyl-2-thiouridine(34) oxidoreductase MnmC [Thalassolituus sp.]
HAWFLDGFSPAKNPDMWNDTLFQQIRRISRQARLDKSDPNHTRMPTVATYAATSAIKRGLCGAGFTLQKTTGFGRKREMTCGRYSLQAGPEINPRAEQRPWLRMPNSMKVPNSLNNHRSVAIIGAGLAGCTSARSLAERGYHIILLDKDGIAQGASGNPQGGLYIKSAVDDNATHSDFYRQAYLYALQRVDSLTSSEGWQACGVLQLAFNEKERQRQQRFLQSQQPPEDFVRGINITQSDAWCDVMQSDDQLAQTNASVEDTSFGGLFYPKAGWVSLVDFCKALIDHPNIHFKQTRVEKLQQTPTSITLECRSGEIPATASSSHSIECSQVVIATAWQTKELLPDAYLPIKSIRGQLTYLDAQTVPPLSTVLCAKSYVPPPQDGRLLIGATYHINDSDTSLRAQDHDTNIENLRQFGAAWSNAADHAKVIGGRVGFRCTTPDYLPIVGPVCDTQATLKSLKPMAKNAHQIPVADMPWQPGIWLNIGHGSRGLVSAPFSAELLTSMMTGNTVSCSSKAMEALLPCRFLIRDMIRRKVTAADD